jgi:hypothetical protein
MLKLSKGMQELQQQMQAISVASTAAGNSIVAAAAAAAVCTDPNSSSSDHTPYGMHASAVSPCTPCSSRHSALQQPQAAAAAAGQILNPQAWWDWLEVQCGLNPLLHAGRAEPWFLQARAQGFVRNPLRYPQRFTADGTRICRPHNYDRCLKIDTCGFDHVHCHHCGAAGHKAVHCHITA